MKFGLDSKQLDYLKKTVLEPVHEAGGKLYCFGSRARGDHRPLSDLDLLVELDSTQARALLGAINEVLQDGNLPFKVDLVLTADLADSYRPSVMKDRVAFEG